MHKFGASGRRVAMVAVVLAWCAGSALGVDGVVPARRGHASYLEPDGALPPATNDLMARVPGVRASTWDGRVTHLFGQAMNAAASADAAQSDWMKANAGAFGVANLDLRVAWVDDLDFGRFTVYAGQQYIEGLPVEYGLSRLLVLNTAEDHRVVAVGAKLAMPPAGGFAADALGADEAAAHVRAMEAFRDLDEWSAPEMVVFTGQDEFETPITAIRAWKFTGRQTNVSAMRAFTFFVNAATGDLTHARYDVHNIDVTGTVQGWATPAPLGNAAADHAGNPPVLRGIPDIRVRINGNNANSAFTDANGNFTISWGGTTPVTIDCSVGDGRWTRVADQGGLALLTASASATPGTPATLILNETGQTEFTNAQLNAFTYVSITHDHWKRYAPTDTRLDNVLPSNTQVTGTCNAFYDGQSTNYYNAGGGCNNTAFSSVASHEYGHHIVARLNLAQGGFGEGFGDTMSMMIYDDPIIGRFFNTSGGPVRTPDTANRQYPCTSTAVHTCGMILGNVVWEIRRAYGTLLGSSLGLELARQQHVDWSRRTTGGTGGNTLNSAHPGTAEEWLTIDDNDMNIANGTPHRPQICAAFAQGGITCPRLGIMRYEFPDGLPGALIAPDRPVSFRVNVVPLYGAPNVASGRMRVSINGASYTLGSLVQQAPNQYLATLPASACGTNIRFYFEATGVVQGQGADTNYSPASADPALGSGEAYSVIAATSIETPLNDDFEAARGWTVGPTTATTGAWERANPAGTAAQPEDDHTPGTGVNCYVTGAAAGTGVGSFDIDGGSTILTSPAFNGTGGCTATLEYWRWYNNNAGAAPFEDTLVVEISDDDGATWEPLETVGPGSTTDAAEVSGGWRFRAFDLNAIPGITASAAMRVRFTASDLINGSIVEAAIDDVRVVIAAGAPSCVADMDDGSGTGTPDGGVTIDDLLFYLSVFQAGLPRADVDNGTGTGTPDGGVTIDDLLYYLVRFEAGC